MYRYGFNSIRRTARVKPANIANAGADQILVKPYRQAYYLSKAAFRVFHSLPSPALIARFSTTPRPLRAKKIKSMGGRDASRKASRTRRLILLRSWALASIFFEIAMPRRARPSIFSLYKTTNSLLTSFLASAKTVSKSRLINSRRDFPKVDTYADKRLRPLARRRLRTRRPPRVAIRARKP